MRGGASSQSVRTTLVRPLFQPPVTFFVCATGLLCSRPQVFRLDQQSHVSESDRFAPGSATRAKGLHTKIYICKWHACGGAVTDDETELTASELRAKMV